MRAMDSILEEVKVRIITRAAILASDRLIQLDVRKIHA
jgi:hypothetical protein